MENANPKISEELITKALESLSPNIFNVLEDKSTFAELNNISKLYKIPVDKIIDIEDKLVAALIYLSDEDDLQSYLQKEMHIEDVEAKQIASHIYKDVFISLKEKVNESSTKEVQNVLDKNANVEDAKKIEANAVDPYLEDPS